MPRQGDNWWAETEDQRRPVLVITRSETVPVLGWVLTAPVTRTVRGIPTEIGLGPSHGLPADCVATLDDLQPIRRSLLTDRVGVLGVEQQPEICRALSAVTDC